MGLMSDSIEAYQPTIQTGNKTRTQQKMWKRNNRAWVRLCTLHYIDLIKKWSKQLFLMMCHKMMDIISAYLNRIDSNRFSCLLSTMSQWKLRRRNHFIWAVWEKNVTIDVKPKKKTKISMRSWRWGHFPIPYPLNLISLSDITYKSSEQPSNCNCILLISNVIEPYKDFTWPQTNLYRDNHHRFTRKLPPNSWLRRFHIDPINYKLLHIQTPMKEIHSNYYELRMKNWNSFRLSLYVNPRRKYQSQSVLSRTLQQH